MQVSSHFTALYAQPSSAEQCSHNALILMDALTHIGINYDCQVDTHTCTCTSVYMCMYTMVVLQRCLSSIMVLMMFVSP